jgi:glutathione S-transferase
MKLIGQYDSPFVRRVGIALVTYGIEFEHLPWSTFGDAAKIAPYSPLRRVPVLVLDDGTVVPDSFAILETIDALAGDGASLARQGQTRTAMLRLAAFAAGAADKGVALVYEAAFREGLPMWVERCEAQVGETLDLLEKERAARPGPWLSGDAPSHADVMLGAMLTFLAEALPGRFPLDRHPALAAHRQACEVLPAFRQVYQPYALARPDR